MELEVDNLSKQYFIMTFLLPKYEVIGVTGNAGASFPIPSQGDAAKQELQRRKQESARLVQSSTSHVVRVR
jgi:hypothetical protein